VLGEPCHVAPDERALLPLFAFELGDSGGPAADIEAEAAEVIGAGLDDRGEGRETQRNGDRDRPLVTKAGDVELQIPKLRQGSVVPSIL